MVMALHSLEGDWFLTEMVFNLLILHEPIKEDSMMPDVEIETFRLHIEIACQKALYEYRKGHVDREAAIAWLNGIFEGAFAVMKVLKQDLVISSDMMEILLEITEKGQVEIVEHEKLALFELTRTRENALSI